MAIEELLNWHLTASSRIYEFYVGNSRLILDNLHAGFGILFNALILTAVLLALVYIAMAVVIRFTKPRVRARSVVRGEEPSVTVQIPTYNELAALNCAERCLTFDYPAEKLQIIIGDDSNDPAVSEAIDAFAAAHPRVHITRRGKNVGYKPGNLNHMLKSTTGEFIVVFDSDFLPKKDFLRKLVAPFLDDDQVSVVQARWRIHNFRQNLVSVLGGTITALCHNIVLPFMQRYAGAGVLCGSGEAIRKRDLDAVGGWRAGSLTEDIECSLRLIQRGKRFVYLEGLEVACEAPFTVRDLCKQQMRWAFGVITSFKQHFRGLFLGKVPLKDKVSAAVFVSGYCFTLLLFLIFTTGMLSLVTGTPGPIDWSELFLETGRNLLVTSGFLVASVFALSVARQARQVPRMVLSSLSVGLVVTFWVNVGILKAVFGREMRWFMLNKQGNAR